MADTIGSNKSDGGMWKNPFRKSPKTGVANQAFDNSSWLDPPPPPDSIPPALVWSALTPEQQIKAKENWLQDIISDNIDYSKSFDNYYTKFNNQNPEGLSLNVLTKNLPNEWVIGADSKNDTKFWLFANMVYLKYNGLNITIVDVQEMYDLIKMTDKNRKVVLEKLKKFDTSSIPKETFYTKYNSYEKKLLLTISEDEPDNFVYKEINKNELAGNLFETTGYYVRMFNSALSSISNGSIVDTPLFITKPGGIYELTQTDIANIVYDSDPNVVTLAYKDNHKRMIEDICSLINWLLIDYIQYGTGTGTGTGVRKSMDRYAEIMSQAGGMYAEDAVYILSTNPFVRYRTDFDNSNAYYENAIELNDTNLVFKVFNEIRTSQIAKAETSDPSIKNRSDGEIKKHMDNIDSDFTKSIEGLIEESTKVDIDVTNPPKVVFSNVTNFLVLPDGVNYIQVQMDEEPFENQEVGKDKRVYLEIPNGVKKIKYVFSGDGEFFTTPKTLNVYHSGVARDAKEFVMNYKNGNIASETETSKELYELEEHFKRKNVYSLKEGASKFVEKMNDMLGIRGRTRPLDLTDPGKRSNDEHVKRSVAKKAANEIYHPGVDKKSKEAFKPFDDVEMKNMMSKNVNKKVPDPEREKKDDSKPFCMDYKDKPDSTQEFIKFAMDNAKNYLRRQYMLFGIWGVINIMLLCVIFYLIYKLFHIILRYMQIRQELKPHSWSVSNIDRNRILDIGGVQSFEYDDDEEEVKRVPTGDEIRSKLRRYSKESGQNLFEAASSKYDNYPKKDPDTGEQADK